MSNYELSELLNAFQAMSTVELSKLIVGLKRELHIDSTPDDPNKVPLHLFTSVVQYVPTLLYDGGPTTTIWLDDPGPNTEDFIDLMREHIENFDAQSLFRMKLLCKRGESFKLVMEYGKAIRFMNRLKSMGASFEFEDDSVAETEEVPITSLPKGKEEILSQAIETTGTGLSDHSATHVIYVYNVFSDDPANEPYAPENTFVFAKFGKNAQGESLWQAFTCLNTDEVRRLKRTHQINFVYEALLPYHVRLSPVASLPSGSGPRVDLKAVEAEILMRFSPQERLKAVKLYRERTNLGLHEALEAVDHLFDSIRQFLSETAD